MPDVVKSFGIAGYAISFEDRLTQVIEAVGGVKAASEIAGVNRDTITNWRDGRSKPSLAGMLELAKAADVSLDWIATGYMVRLSGRRRLDGSKRAGRIVRVRRSQGAVRRGRYLRHRRER